MEIAISRKLVVSGGIAVALVAGWHVGNGEFLVPGLVAVCLALLVMVRLTRVEPDALVVGAVLFGYLVGNRGFAQLHVPGIPLLPGEAALGLAATVGLWRAATTKSIPVRRDALNYFVLLWIALASVRLFHDVRVYGFMAIRDFATIYYALFFFVAQDLHVRSGDRRWIERCLTAGFALCTPVAAAFFLWPETIIRAAVAGAPLVFVKGDVVGGFMAAGVFWFAAAYARKASWTSFVFMVVNAAGVVFANSRAALVSLLVGAATVFVLGERRFRRALLLLAAGVVLMLAMDAAWPRPFGTHSRAFRLYESVVSALDFSGTFIPQSEDLGDKPDNNRFRLVWWQAVADETIQQSPWFGLGFGSDLADEFIRRYYADIEEFSARSPHNFLLTLFARTGVVGLAVFTGVMVVMAMRTWRASRHALDSGAGAQWLAPWMILIAACFGVILEGPMGAAVFWTALGLANAAGKTDAPSDAEAAIAAGATPLKTASAR